jgi:hypothetical protein
MTHTRSLLSLQACLHAEVSEQTLFRASQVSCLPHFRKVQGIYTCACLAGDPSHHLGSHRDLIACWMVGMNSTVCICVRPGIHTQLKLGLSGYLKRDLRPHETSLIGAVAGGFTGRSDRLSQVGVTACHTRQLLQTSLILQTGFNWLHR